MRGHNTEANVIESERLRLISMTPAFLTACLAGDRAGAEAALGHMVPADALHENSVKARRLAQLQKDPELQPWLLRAIVERRSGAMIGRIGCHDYPGAEHLQPYAPNGVEIGYEVFPNHRRQGYAHEATAALIEWLHRAQKVNQFVLSISPDNLPSLRLAEKLGFQLVGQWEDEEDGPEEVFVLQWQEPNRSA